MLLFLVGKHNPADKAGIKQNQSYYILPYMVLKEEETNEKDLKDLKNLQMNLGSKAKSYKAWLYTKKSHTRRDCGRKEGQHIMVTVKEGKKDFDALVDYVNRGITMLLDADNADRVCNYCSFGWADYANNGTNPCYKRGRDDDMYTIAQFDGAVIVALEKGSERHKKLANGIAAELGCTRVTYPWLVQALGRFFCNQDQSLEDLADMASLQRSIQKRMKEKGLKEFHSLDDLR